MNHLHNQLPLPGVIARHSQHSEDNRSLCKDGRTHLAASEHGKGLPHVTVTDDVLLLVVVVDKHQEITHYSTDGFYVAAEASSHARLLWSRREESMPSEIHGEGADRRGREERGQHTHALCFATTLLSLGARHGRIRRELDLT